jgi:hypothetical protein
MTRRNASRPSGWQDLAGLPATAHAASDLAQSPLPVIRSKLSGRGTPRKSTRCAAPNKEQIFDSLPRQWQKYFMIKIVKTQIFARGITIVTRKDDATGAADIGLETTPEGLTFLKKLAQRKRITLEALACDILKGALERPARGICLDDLTPEEIGQLMDDAIKRDGEFVIDATPLFDEIEAAEAAVGHTTKHDE